MAVEPSPWRPGKLHEGHKMWQKAPQEINYMDPELIYIFLIFDISKVKTDPSHSVNST